MRGEGKKKMGRNEIETQKTVISWACPQDLTSGPPTPETLLATTLQLKWASSFGMSLASEHHGGGDELGTPGARVAGVQCGQHARARQNGTSSGPVLTEVPGVQKA